ncbi:MAG: glycoside hydrolase family 2 protein [Acidobacteriota bacterium]
MKNTLSVFSVMLMLFVFILPALGQAPDRSFPQIPPSVLAPPLEEASDAGDPMASRLFRTTSTRPQIQLGGFWDFVTDPDGVGESQRYFAAFPNPETRIWVPGTWNCYGRYWHYEGPAWLRRTFEVPAEGQLRLRFAGVFYLAKVWLDGKLLGDHEGGYTPFSFVVNHVAKGEHEIVVLVDNRLHDESLPKKGVDWFPYGGIYRPVYAELVPGLFIDSFHVVPVAAAGQATLKVKAFLRNPSGQERRERITFEVNRKILYSAPHALTGTTPEVTFSAVLENPRLWSPESPFLYSARLSLQENRDDQFTRFGIRSFTLDGYKILLNGRRFKLAGANHHDDHPDWGSALPPHIIRQDIEILKRMGANAVRSHYPNDEVFMDYCDANGLAFMSEVPAWQYSTRQLASPAVQNKIKSQFADMVYRDMNHPCVFSWSLGNEWPEFDKSYEVMKSLVQYAKSVDSTHFLTYVTGGAKFGNVSRLLDIISTNWAQYQWYDPFTCLDGEEGKKSLADLDKIHEAFPDKPVILTEFGGAESQAGWHNWGNVKWSEEYQARNVADSGRYGLSRDWISGGCVWQFCDSRSTPSRFLSGRLHGWNAKGVVDSYRAPKLAFYELQRLFHQYRWTSEEPSSPTTRSFD